MVKGDRDHCGNTTRQSDVVVKQPTSKRKARVQAKKDAKKAELEADDAEE